MKQFKYLLAAIVMMVLAGSCAQPDSEFSHKKNEITAIYISPAFATISATVAGKIDQKTGKILFPIKKTLHSSFDLTKLKVRANVPYDVKVTPSLSGIKNLEEEFSITVTATETGETKHYTLQAYKSSEL